MDRWKTLGRFLPKDVRERVFEPAYTDMMRRWLESPQRSRRPFGLHAVATYAACVPIAVPRMLVRHGRLTCVGKALVWGGAAAVLLTIVAVNIAEAYATYGSR